MIGDYITFLVAVAIVATYMTIVHSFLRSAELPEDRAREEREREAVKSAKPVGGRAQFAH